MHLSKFLAIVLSAQFFTGTPMAQNPTVGGSAVAPDSWLLVDQGPPWWYRTTPSPTPAPIFTRVPRHDESALVDRARGMLATQPIKAIALLDGDNVVFSGFNTPANESSTLFGFSMGKTITAMAVGQAICQGKLTLETKAESVLPRLAGTDLGKATVHDLLRMASGVYEGNPDSSVWNEVQARAWSQGRLDLADLVADPRVNSARAGVFSNYKAGEAFNYKSTDPIVLGMMVSHVTAMPWSRWAQSSVLDPMGASASGLYVQDRQQNGLADSGARLKLADWIRFAVWVKRQSVETSCFGRFVQSALKTQIRNAGTAQSRRFGKLFGGYGYFVWTDNEVSSDTAFASGWGGQRISWSNDPKNSRMVVVFSGVESWMPDLYAFVREWNRIPSVVR